MEGDLDTASLKVRHGKYHLRGWCSGPGFTGPPLAVRALVDKKVVANGTAEMHRQKAGNHGFLLQVTSSQLDMPGEHRLQVQCRHGQQWFDLKGSPLCVKNGATLPC